MWFTYCNSVSLVMPHIHLSWPQTGLPDIINKTLIHLNWIKCLIDYETICPSKLNYICSDLCAVWRPWGRRQMIAIYMQSLWKICLCSNCMKWNSVRHYWYDNHLLISPFNRGIWHHGSTAVHILRMPCALLHIYIVIIVLILIMWFKQRPKRDLC